MELCCTQNLMFRRGAQFCEMRTRVRRRVVNRIFLRLVACLGQVSSGVAFCMVFAPTMSIPGEEDRTSEQRLRGG